MYNNELLKTWEMLKNIGVSEQTLQIVTRINGYNMQTLNDIYYAHTSYRSFNQLEQKERMK